MELDLGVSTAGFVKTEILNGFLPSVQVRVQVPCCFLLFPIRAIA